MEIRNPDRTIIDGIEIRNVADYAKRSSNKYLVATYADGEWWFWGIYPTMQKALAPVIETDLTRCVFFWDK